MQTIQTILAPTDYSAASRQAMNLACDLARARHARVVALHAIEPPMYYGGFEQPAAPPVALRRELEAWTAQSCGPVGTPPVECVVAEGYATAEILRQARERGCDLIVMGSAVKKGMDRLILGNVAEAVARRAHCPVLLCKPPAAPGEAVPASFATTGLSQNDSPEGGQSHFAPKTPQNRDSPRPFCDSPATILLPTDLSEPSSAAVPVALALAGPETRLIALHVKEPDEPESAAAERFRAKLAAAGARAEYRNAAGSPADTIVRTAGESHCDLIVMSSHGRTGFNRWLLGSVAESVFRSARCPVLIVRPVPEHAEVAAHGA